ncbi:Dyp-type peroxidase [Dendrothele bispora CBS 962.96]|uniref:Dyp-type peroxidase n=1 Tax=Dendrothele bispora (strain CBS 962.96) TaxID=1314807 RepID=A0A4V6T5Q0_DENBC|nr:Dyp-type peroxidase [Dendrothele bispora CBS 962.96]
MSTASLDLNNIQGDILVGIPKKTQTYFFFEIQGDPSLFRKALVDIVPLIKNASQAQKDRDAIKEHKHKGDGTLLHMTGTQIAFSHAGLEKVCNTDPSADPFIEGQFKDAKNIGDAGTDSGTKFVPAWDPAFGDANIDGVIFVGGDSHQSVNHELQKIKLILGPSVKEAIHIRGDTRPGKESGHEHFGFLDGISNPTITGFNDKNAPPGPKAVNASVLLTGQDSKSSPVFVDGSFLAFRYLFQLVPEFNQFLKENPIKGDSELLGARMVGRWKSGAPIDLTPTHDNPELGKDPKRNNNFFYSGELKKGDQTRCPYSAHTRKTNPRADFTEHDREDALNERRIMRRGIQFGPEVTEEEAKHHRSLHGRGLLFVCYQSDLTKGFQFIQQSWANAPDFLDLAVDSNLKKIEPGLDSIIGQNADQARGVVGTDPAKPDGSISIPRFIVPRGGEYFFSPSISALRDVIALGVNIG